MPLCRGHTERFFLQPHTSFPWPQRPQTTPANSPAKSCRPRVYLHAKFANHRRPSCRMCGRLKWYELSEKHTTRDMLASGVCLKEHERTWMSSHRDVLPRRPSNPDTERAHVVARLSRTQHASLMAQVCCANSNAWPCESATGANDGDRHEPGGRRRTERATPTDTSDADKRNSLRWARGAPMGAGNADGRERRCRARAMPPVAVGADAGAGPMRQGPRRARAIVMGPSTANGWRGYKRAPHSKTGGGRIGRAKWTPISNENADGRRGCERARKTLPGAMEADGRNRRRWARATPTVASLADGHEQCRRATVTPTEG